MKKLIILIGIVILASCSYEQESITQPPQVAKHTVSTVRYNPGVYIITVDGHEYLTCSNGGIVHLETCIKCKK